MNFIELFNVVSDAARPIHAGQHPATSMEDTLSDLGMDSLDGLIMAVYLCEIYGIPEDEETKEWHPTSLQEVFDYVMRRKTREPESIEAVKEAIK